MRRGHKRIHLVSVHRSLLDSDPVSQGALGAKMKIYPLI